MLSHNRVHQEIKQLTELLNAASAAYYNTRISAMTDAEYDSLYRRLELLENQHPEHTHPDSPIGKVGSKPSVGQNVSKHCMPMYSLSNVYNAEDIAKFYKRVDKLNTTGITPIYTYEPKLDGIAVRLTYISGELSDAALRGDGTIGEALHDPNRFIKNIPTNINIAGLPRHKIVEVYGEVVISKADFELANTRMREMGAAEYSNPRSLVAGAVRANLDHFNTQFIAHGFGYIDTSDITIDGLLDSSLNYLESLGFKTPGYIDENCCYNTFYPDNLAFETDGVVIKVAQYDIRQALGYTAKSPRWATAFKFPPKEAVTQLTDIIYQVGRTGVITPVGIFEPVVLGGVTITNANLCNKDEMNRLGIGIGDLITVARQAEVIPKIIRVVESRNNPEVFPTQCPSCGGSLQVTPGVVAIKCVNEFNTCKAILIQRLIHFTSRKAMDIKGLGDTIISQLVEKGLICDDIYTIYHDDFDSRLRTLGVSEKIISKIMAKIVQSKSRPIAKFIFGLGLDGVGESKAIELAKEYSDRIPDTLDEIKVLGWKLHRDVLGIK